uniref:Uncharacterized protein n=1 Tax=Panagrolaimus superbus TaxID=310955 RepID=A0A914YLK6_9BILA
MALCAPELLCFIRCFHRTLFRNVKRPTIIQFLTVLIIESLHAFGVGMLVFKILPDFSAETAAMLSNALCLVPSILSILSRRAAKLTLLLIIIDIAAIIPQSSGFWAWPVLVPEIRSKALLICISLTLISLAWWQNFVHSQSFLPPIRQLGAFANRLSERRSKTYVIVSLWKCVIYLICLFFFLSPKIGMDNLMQRDPFGEKLITITASNLNSTQISHFIKRMHEYEDPDYGKQAATREVSEEEEEEDLENMPITAKKPWDNDEDAIDAGEYEKSEIKKKKRMKRKAKLEVEEDEEEAISAYNLNFEQHLRTFRCKKL